MIILAYHHILNRCKVVHKVELLEYKTYFVPPYVRQIPGILLCNVNAVQNHFAAGRFIHATDYVKHGRFSRTGRTHYRNPFSFLNVQADVLQRLDRSAAVNL